MPAKSIARSEQELVVAAPDTSVRDCARLMDEYSVGSVILTVDDEPVGILTDRDIALRTFEHERPSELTANDLMSDDLVTADGDEGIFELCDLMQKHAVRRIPIVEDGRLTGIVTLDDLVILLEDEMHDLSEVIRAESPPF
jgi:CBS domain-containing protein